MSFPKYDRYKASDVDWLGSVPRNWRVVSLRRLTCDHRQGYYSSESYVDDGTKLLRITDIKKYGRIDFADCPRVQTSEALAPFLLLQGDFVFARTGGAGTYGVVTTLSEPCAYASYLIRFRFSSDAQPDFLRFVFSSEAFQDAVKRHIHGGVNQNVHAEDIKEQVIALPSTEEQSAISAFLDRETAKIDALVDEQKRLIELLKEKRQAVISHAVTKGLAPNAPMKDSGVEWLGQVPQHWQVGKLGRWLDILSGYAFPSASFTDDQSVTRLLRGINVGVQKVSWDETVYWDRQLNDGLDRFALSVGEVVIGMDRPWISEGTRVAVLGREDVPCLLLQRVAALRSRSGLERMHLYLLLQSREFVDFLTPDMTGVSVPHISPEQIRAFPVAIPPTSEQIEIVRHVEGEVARIDGLIDKAQCAIALLLERRSALISAAVTGKIDVRGVTAEIAEAAA